MTLHPRTVTELCEMIRVGGRLLPRGGGSKPGLSTPLREEVESLDLSVIDRLVEYIPGEFTFTALAGMRIAEINPILKENHQYLPFDPLLSDKGATLGGTVAANATGAGRYHYGGVRDFLLGVRFVNSEGILVHGGGKVVKNAAGFDLPKLMVGSLGELGVMTELSFKVFPRPEAYVTLRAVYPALDTALEAMQKASSARLDIDSLELESSNGEWRLWARLGGIYTALLARASRLRGILGKCELIEGEAEVDFWDAGRQLSWVPQGWLLVKVPLTPGLIPDLEAKIARGLKTYLGRDLEPGREPIPVLRRYSAGGQIAWLVFEGDPRDLEPILQVLKLNGLVYFGPPGKRRLGVFSGESFYRRIKSALDPSHRFAGA